MDNCSRCNGVYREFNDFGVTDSGCRRFPAVVVMKESFMFILSVSSSDSISKFLIAVVGKKSDN